jgi:hypothetical protein
MGHGAPALRSSLSGSAQALALPAYFPLTPQGASDWSSLVGASPATALAVANPGNGPDTGSHGPDPTWQARITAAQSAGLVVVGYVYTTWTAAPIATVEAAIDNWYAWYPQIDGIFVDQVTTNAQDAQAPSGYYSELYSYIKAKGGKGWVVDNIGAQGPEAFMSACDIMINFEGDDAVTPYASFTPADWVSNYDPSRFWHLVYNVQTLAEMQSIAQLSKGKNAGYLFVTDQLGSGNTWGTLPQGTGFWTSELEYVQPLSRWRASNGGSSLTYRFQFANTWDWKRVYIDQDRSPQTGFQYVDANGTLLGADYLIENGSLYRYSGSGPDWNWTFLKGVGQNIGGSGLGAVNFVEWDLAQSDIGPTSGTDLVFEVERSGGPRMNGFRYTHLYSSASGPLNDYFAENDSTRLYFQATAAEPWTYRRVFIDIDSNASTGFGYRGIGADYLIENGLLYQYTGDGSSWSWTVLGTSNLTQSGQTLTWWAWRATLPGPGGAGLKMNGGSANLVFMGSGGHRTYAAPLYREVFSP